MESEKLEEHRLTINQTESEAARMVAEMALPISVELPMRVVGLGVKIAKIAEKIRSELDDEFGADLPKVIATAVHEYWFAACAGAAYIRSCIDDGEMYDNEYTRRMATPAGYADIDGWANVLANAFADVVPNEARIRCIKDLLDADILDEQTALNSMALFWLHQAAACQSEGLTDAAYDLLHEAHESLRSHTVNRVWSDAFKEGARESNEISAAKARSELARKAGNAAHVDTHKLKKEVEVFWRENIPSTLGNDAAASILMHEFPLKFRTLSGYVSEFKIQPSSST